MIRRARLHAPAASDGAGLLLCFFNEPAASALVLAGGGLIVAGTAVKSILDSR